MMIIYLRILGSLIFSLIGLSSIYGQFLGGNADGHANIRIINIVCAITTVNPYGGGVADGHANIRITNIPCPITTVNPFGGGVADGHANIRITNIPCPITTVNPFGGGVADGHANIRITNIPCPITTVNPYGGGVADGHANIRITNIPCPISTVNPFGGGVADGHANIRITNIPCPITTINPFSGGIADGHGNIRIMNTDPADPSACPPLPIELLFFNAMQNGKIVDVTWITASEWNNDYFTVEKTIDTYSYEAVGKMNGAGNSSVSRHYSLIDYYPFQGISYYRLKQTDFNGQYKNYNPVAVQFYSSGIAVYPTVSAGAFYITCDEGNNMEIKIYNVYGEIIYYSKINFNKSEIDLSKQPNGIYFINIITEQGTANKKTIINK